MGRSSRFSRPPTPALPRKGGGRWEDEMLTVSLRKGGGRWEDEMATVTLRKGGGRWEDEMPTVTLRKGGGRSEDEMPTVTLRKGGGGLNVEAISRPPPRPSPQGGGRLRPRQEKYRGDVETPSPTLPARGREIRRWKGPCSQQATTRTSQA